MPSAVAAAKTGSRIPTMAGATLPSQKGTTGMKRNDSRYQNPSCSSAGRSLSTSGPIWRCTSGSSAERTIRKSSDPPSVAAVTASPAPSQRPNRNPPASVRMVPGTRQAVQNA